MYVAKVSFVFFNFKCSNEFLTSALTGKFLNLDKFCKIIGAFVYRYVNI